MDNVEIVNIPPAKIRVNVRSEERVTMGTRDVVAAGGTSDYNLLRNRPKLNGKTIEGEHDSEYYLLDMTYIHNQGVASDVWTVAHNLGKYPSVTVVDSAGTVVIGDVAYLDSDNIEISFCGAFSGTAYLN